MTKQEAITTAHSSEVIGKYSQVIAKAALMAGGYEVAETETDEAYDFVAKDPLNGEWYTLQCKTVRIRDDRGGQLVVYTTNGNGERYSKEDVDYFVAVLAQNGENPRVFMFENRGLREYWVSEESAKTRWVELPIAIDRQAIQAISERKQNEERAV